MAQAGNALNISQQGTIYFDGVSDFSGLDGGSVGNILTSNGTGVAPSFQAAPAGGNSPYFLAYCTSSATGSTFDPIVYDTVLVNVGSAYNGTTGVFTAPSNGTYFFSGCIVLAGTLSSSITDMRYFFTIPSVANWGVIGLNPFTIYNVPQSFFSITCTCTALLTAGQAIHPAAIFNGNVTLGGAAGTYFQFSGFKVGP